MFEQCNNSILSFIKYCYKIFLFYNYKLYSLKLKLKKFIFSYVNRNKHWRDTLSQIFSYIKFFIT